MMRNAGSMLGALVLAVLLTACAAGPSGHSGAQANDLVLVAGATGRTGERVVKQLLAKHYRVRALVRNAAKAKAELPDGVETVVADVRDPATLRPAMVGVTYVISAIGAGGMKPVPGNGAQEVDNLGNANLAAAAKAVRVAQFVLISSMSTSDAANYPMAFMRPILVAKLQGENAVRASGVPYTIVKPGGLLDDAGGKNAVTFEPGDAPGMGRITRNDLATVCVEALGRRSAWNKSVSVVGGTAPAPNNWEHDFAAIKADSR